MKVIISLLIINFIQTGNISSQVDSNYVTVIPGQEYKAGWLHKLFFGEHWRELWITPIEVPLLNLNKFGGGLTPSEKGGGFQTKSLRFKAENGKTFKFRSINKNPDKLLPKELQKTFVADILNDQISSSHPIAAIVAAPLLNEVGILNARPIIVVLPYDEKLGKYKEEFGGLLGTLEEHPDVADDDTIGFAGADKVKSTFKMFAELEEDNDDQVVSTEFLKARLMDILLGDWDRHVDQWRWARYKKESKKLWYPIPRDRDQVFAKFNGVFSWIAENAIPQIEGFRDYYPEIEDLTWSGRFLDRRFLNSITKSEWDSVTQFVYLKMTEISIENAVKMLPQNYFNLCGDELTKTLKARRDKLKKASEEYYDLIFEHVDIKGSNKDEYAEINRLNDGSVEVALYKKDKSTNQKKGNPFFNRKYHPGETDEIRIDLLDGNDVAEINGNVDESITIRVTGGKGKDQLIDNSKVNGFLFSVLPVPSAEYKTIFYDSGKESLIKAGPGTCTIKDKYPEPKSDSEKYEPSVRDWGHDWKFGPMFNYTSDEGLLIGGGPILYEFGYRAAPYIYRMHLLAGYAPKLKNYVIDYNGKFYSIIPGAKLELTFRKSELAVLNFYGFGNETERNKKLENSEYYKAEQEIYLLNPSTGIDISDKLAFSAGILFKYSQVKLRDSTLIKSINPYGTEDIVSAAIHSEIKFDTRDHSLSPSTGIFLKTTGSYSPNVFTNKNDFLKGSLEGKFYHTEKMLTPVTLALKLKAEKIWGVYPFYESAFIGGSKSLRGYNRERFAGDASIEANAEIRIFLTKTGIIIPGGFGISLFTETGRVFVKGESSNQWHNSIGGGIWFYLVNRDLLFSLSYGKSVEDYGIYAYAGFGF